MIKEYLNGMTKEGEIVKERKVGLDRFNNVEFYAIQKHLTNSYFHTSKGYKKVDPLIAMVVVKYGPNFSQSMELIAGVAFQQAIDTAMYLIRSKFAVEDIPTMVEKCCNLPAINRTVERRLQFLEEQEALLYKEICVDAEEEDMKIYTKTNDGYGMAIPTFTRVKR